MGRVAPVKADSIGSSVKEMNRLTITGATTVRAKGRNTRRTRRA